MQCLYRFAIGALRWHWMPQSKNASQCACNAFTVSQLGPFAGIECPKAKTRLSARAMPCTTGRLMKWTTSWKMNIVEKIHFSRWIHENVDVYIPSVKVHGKVPSNLKVPCHPKLFLRPFWWTIFVVEGRNCKHLFLFRVLCSTHCSVSQLGLFASIKHSPDFLLQITKTKTFLKTFLKTLTYNVRKMPCVTGRLQVLKEEYGREDTLFSQNLCC